jgi:hypothetical protein
MQRSSVWRRILLSLLANTLLGVPPAIAGPRSGSLGSAVSPSAAERSVYVQPRLITKEPNTFSALQVTDGARGSSLLGSCAAAPRRRITGGIDERVRVILPGHVHPLARAEFDQGRVDDNMALGHMVLELRRSDA